MVARPNFLYFLILVFLIQLPYGLLAQSSDVYAIYSGLISKSPVVRSGPGNVPTDDEIYLIEETTRTSRDGFGSRGARSMEPADSCIRVPAADETAYQEILADYDSRKNKPVTLAGPFSFSKPYRLLTTAEAEQFLKDALDADPQIRVPTIAPPVNRNPLYQKSRRVFRVSDVYFNKSRTLALVYFAVYTNTVDSAGGWRALRKTDNGQWEANNTWPTCSWRVIR